MTIVLLFVLGIILVGLGYGACILKNIELFKKRRGFFSIRENTMRRELFTNNEGKRKRHSSYGGQYFCRVGATSNLGRFMKKNQDAITYEGSMLGKIVEITDNKKNVLGKGILLSEQIIPNDDLIQVVQFYIYTKDNEIKRIEAPVRSVHSSSVRNTLGEVKYIGENDSEKIIAVIKDYCKNRCIMDCTDCTLKKYYKKRGDK